MGHAAPGLFGGKGLGPDPIIPEPVFRSPSGPSAMDSRAATHRDLAAGGPSSPYHDGSITSGQSRASEAPRTS